MPHVITRSCCNDATCVAVCPVDCIHPTPDEPDYRQAEMLYIDPANCIDCGACVEVCPVDAISAADELAPAASRYVEINARYFADRPYPRRLAEAPSIGSAGGDPAGGGLAGRAGAVGWVGGPMVAIVGSGPAACYAAAELLAAAPGARVRLFERLPAPWGLVRYGVSPQHPDTKAVSRLFQRTAAGPDLTLHLNVEIGRHLSHAELLAHHHAVLYAVGAPSDRPLGIPGEQLPGSHSATDFVAWYNGHPDHADQRFDLSGDRAVVVGNGNVALDVARILVADPAALAGTDIADHALAALRGSRIREVVLLGRRGPAQAAFSVAELLSLSQLEGVELLVDPLPVAEQPSDPIAALKAGLIAELAGRPPGPASAAGAGGSDHATNVAMLSSSVSKATLLARIRLRFLSSPLELLGAERVTGLLVGRNELVDGPDGRPVPRPTGHTERLDCGLVLRAVGYRGTPVPGLPFDERTGTLPNDGARVIDPATGVPLPGCYAAGWIKRGPSGVIGTNRRCAQETVGQLLADHAAGRLPEPSGDAAGLAELLARRQPEVVGYRGWKAIDAVERARGREQGRPRVKLVRRADLLEVARVLG
jgi:ferredoxin--NADP+ reductase